MGCATVSGEIFFSLQNGELNHSRIVFFPLLELQLPQQIAMVFGLFHGGRWFRCSIVAQSPCHTSVAGVLIILWQ